VEGHRDLAQASIFFPRHKNNVKAFSHDTFT
jgi:hypothetical protein